MFVDIYVANRNYRGKDFVKYILHFAVLSLILKTTEHVINICNFNINMIQLSI